MSNSQQHGIPSEHNAYLKYKMVAVSASRQNWRFDTHINWKEWWCLNIILLKVFLLFWKFFFFQEFSCTFKKKGKLMKLKELVFPLLKVPIEDILELPNVSHLVAFDITVLAKNSFPFDNLTPTWSTEVIS